MIVTHSGRTARALLLGSLLATAGMFGLHLAFATEAKLILALFLALTCSIYLGSMLSQTQSRGTQLAELCIALAVFVTAILGIAKSSFWLAIGYTCHAIWDWLHHSQLVKTRIAYWFPPIVCGIRSGYSHFDLCRDCSKLTF